MVGVDTSLASLGRREREKMETRRALKDAALDLDLARGVESLTVEAVGEASEVAPRTFFNYFAREEDPLVSEVAEAAHPHRRLVEQASTGPPSRAVIARSDFFNAAHGGRERVPAQRRPAQEHPPLRSRQLARYASARRTFGGALAERFGAALTRICARSRSRCSQ